MHKLLFGKPAVIDVNRCFIFYLTYQTRMKMKKILLFTILYLCLSNANAQGPVINIPDANFKAYLVANFDANTDGNIDSTEANVTGAINVFNLSIADLTGIEAFRFLTDLNCGSNQLTSLNVSANTALTGLNCYNNQLTSLNVAANTALTQISCSYNQLTSLNVSANTALILLSCFNNQLTSLNLSANTALAYLVCDHNQLTSLNLSANTALAASYCYNNQLTSLNVKNGNNIYITGFDARNNPNLNCIQVDDFAYSDTTSGWFKDVTASYSTDCSVGIEDLFRDNKMAIYPNPNNGEFKINNFPKHGALEIFNMPGEKIYSGILKDGNVKLHASAGIYIVKVTDEEKSYTQKLVIQ
jgi:hypothetical protein